MRVGERGGTTLEVMSGGGGEVREGAKVATAQRLCCRGVGGVAEGEEDDGEGGKDGVHVMRRKKGGCKGRKKRGKGEQRGRV